MSKMYTLVIGKRHRSEHDHVYQAQRAYCELRDESGEGSSTWPDGQIVRPSRRDTIRISYNGRMWIGDTEVV